VPTVGTGSPGGPADCLGTWNEVGGVPMEPAYGATWLLRLRLGLRLSRSIPGRRQRRQLAVAVSAAADAAAWQVISKSSGQFYAAVGAVAVRVGLGCRGCVGSSRWTMEVPIPGRGRGESLKSLHRPCPDLPTPTVAATVEGAGGRGCRRSIGDSRTGCFSRYPLFRDSRKSATAGCFGCLCCRGDSRRVILRVLRLSRPAAPATAAAAAEATVGRFGDGRFGDGRFGDGRFGDSRSSRRSRRPHST
jgi:hypothetical protein